MLRSRPKWLEFEEAVGKFIAALDPSAAVTPNARLVDRDTSSRRQRDVWIETKVLGHYPVAILVSCKRYRRKLNLSDIEAFIGELVSSGAHKGVLYSYSGFGEMALAKAKKYGISCCRLFVDEPAEIPEEMFIACYYFTQQMRLHLISMSGHAPLEVKTWRELFEFRSSDGKAVIDLIVEGYDALVEASMRTPGAPPRLPIPVQREHMLSICNGIVDKITLLIGVMWVGYKANVNAYRVSGSYSETDRHLLGTYASPVIDLHSAHPGPGWSPVEDIPPPTGSFLCVFKIAKDIRPELLRAFEKELLPPLQIRSLVPGEDFLNPVERDVETF